MKFYVLYIVIICVAMIVIIVRINDYYKKQKAYNLVAHATEITKDLSIELDC